MVDFGEVGFDGGWILGMKILAVVGLGFSGGVESMARFWW